MAGGRPTDYTPEMADIICARIAEGRAVISIAKDDDMPAQGTIYRWLFNHLEFQEKYARAREVQADIFAEEILQIADDGKNDTYLKDGKEETNHDVIARSRLRVDSRKWLASKLKPKKYGDSINQKHTDGDGRPLKTNDAAQAVLAVLTTEQLEKALAEVAKDD